MILPLVSSPPPLTYRRSPSISSHSTLPLSVRLIIPCFLLCSSGLPFPIKLGDCFRLGSVGLVVSEMRTADGGDDQRLDNKTLQYLKDEALEFEAVSKQNTTEHYISLSLVVV